MTKFFKTRVGQLFTWIIVRLIEKILQPYAQQRLQRKTDYAMLQQTAVAKTWHNPRLQKQRLGITHDCSIKDLALVMTTLSKSFTSNILKHNNAHVKGTKYFTKFCITFWSTAISSENQKSFFWNSSKDFSLRMASFRTRGYVVAALQYLYSKSMPVLTAFISSSMSLHASSLSQLHRTRNLILYLDFWRHGKRYCNPHGRQRCCAGFQIQLSYWTRARSVIACLGDNVLDRWCIHQL